MKQILLFLIFMIPLVSFCQKSKKETYYIYDNNLIKQKQFRQFDTRKIFINEVENDTAIIKHIFFHKNLGHLDSIQYEQLKNVLIKITDSSFNENVKTMIHLYRNENQIHEDADNTRYWDWIANNSDKYQSLLIGTKNSKINSDTSKHIYLDNYNLLENLFFSASKFEINHLLLKPNGEVYIFYGIDDILNVLDWSVD